MKAEHVRKKERIKRRNPVLKISLFLLGVYIVVSLASLHMEIVSKQEELQMVIQQCEEQRISNKEIKRQISLGDDQTYLARIARDKLGMGYSDEHVFRDAAVLNGFSSRERFYQVAANGENTRFLREAA